MKRRIQDFNNIAFQIIKRPEPKIFGTRKENGVSIPHVLSTIYYAHTLEKHAKWDILSKHAIQPLLGA